MSLLGNYFDEESKDLEFKEFYLKISPDFLLTSEEISVIINTGQWNSKMNKIIDINIRNYFRYYVPKYISCYMNSNINGKLIFGIDDFGEISGIPYIGDININLLNSYFRKVVMKYTNGLSNYNDVTIQVKKLNTDINILDDLISDNIKDMNDKIAEFNKINLEYKLKKIKWLKEINKYSTKFYNIMNRKDSRIKLVAFCKKHNAAKHIIDLLESDKEIPVELNKVFYKRFRDKNDVVHWAGEFKDYNIEQLQEIKPTRGELPKITNSCLLLRKISDLRYRFLKNNNNINYYIIIVKINGKSNDKVISFRLDSNTNDWLIRSRVVTPMGPGCI